MEVTKALEDEADFVVQVFEGVSADGKIVHVDNKPPFSDIVCEVEIHKCLEHRRRSTKSKKHHHWFKQSQGSDEGGFPLVALLNSNIVISPLYIELSEMGKLSEVGDEVGDKREGIHIFDGMFIEISVILDWLEFAILLFDKEEGRSLGGFRWSDSSCLEVFVDKVLAGNYLLWVQQI